MQQDVLNIAAGGYAVVFPRMDSFYRWNEFGDDYYFYSIIAKHISSMMYWFEFGNAFEDRHKWYGELSDSMVRLIIQRC